MQFTLALLAVLPAVLALPQPIGSHAQRRSAQLIAPRSIFEIEPRAEFTLQNGKDAQALNAKFQSLTATSSCTDGEQACVGSGFGQCVGGQFQVTPCAGGTTCFALPLVNKAGTSITCDTNADAEARIATTGATGGVTGSGGGAATNAAASSSTAAASGTATTGSASGADNSECDAGNDTGAADNTSAATGSDASGTASTSDAPGAGGASNASASAAPAAAGSSSFQLSNGQAAQALNAKFASLTASSSCTEGESACVGGGFAQCVGGTFQVSGCSAGTVCAALPLVNKAGTSIACDTEADAVARITNTGATGGLTGSS